MKTAKALKFFGSRQALADALGVTRQAVHKWVKAGVMPELASLKTEKLMDKKKAA